MRHISRDYTRILEHICHVKINNIAKVSWTQNILFHSSIHVQNWFLNKYIKYQPWLLYVQSIDICPLLKVRSIKLWQWHVTMAVLCKTKVVQQHNNSWWIIDVLVMDWLRYGAIGLFGMLYRWHGPLYCSPMYIKLNRRFFQYECVCLHDFHYNPN